MRLFFNSQVEADRRISEAPNMMRRSRRSVGGREAFGKSVGPAICEPAHRDGRQSLVPRDRGR